ncbi:MAG: tetratricopeptide repeat protein [Geminicoccaceae bacterium]|nr:tetratricopeptide repeat protein [Geminicoccaceae bacterium]
MNSTGPNEPVQPNTGEIRQKIEQHGSGNIAVQASESTVTITIGGRARLVLERRHAVSRRVRYEVDLLRAEAAAVPLVGRDEAMRRLEAWLEDPAPISVHAIVGGAGAGKTRLGLELCRRAEERGWRAGFVAAHELRRFAQHESVAAWDRDGATLVVVDHAARSAGSLNALLRALVGRPPQEPKMRFLLLETHAEAEAGWWADVRRIEGLSDDLLLDWFTGSVPETLAPIAELDDRRAILEGTFKALREYKLAAAVPELPPPGADPAFEQALAAPGADRAPLFLMLAALFAAEAGLASALSLGRLDLALWLAIRERDLLRALAQDLGVNRELLPHLVARITLSRGVLVGDLPEVIGEERKALRLERGVALEDVAAALREALPVRQEAGGERLAHLEPDIVGEAFCLLLLTRPGFGARAQEALVLRAGRRNLRRTARQLVLLCRDFARDLPATGARAELEKHHPEFARLAAWLGKKNPALAWLRALAERVESPLHLLEIAGQVPLGTLVLGELAAALEERFVALVDSRDERARPRALAELCARALNNLGNRLAALGRRGEALEKTQRAVALYRTLADEQPQAYRPGLAMSLNNLGVRLAEVGRFQEALARTEEAVELYRALRKARPDAFPRELAASLNNLGNRLAELGRAEEACAATAEAVAIRRELAKERPEVYRPELAMNLANLGNRLAELGRLDEARAASEEAERLYRALANERPDAFRPHLAGALISLGARLVQLGRYEEARARTEQAVGLYRGLANAQPAAFRPALAASLNKQGHVLSELGRREEALAAIEEAVAIRRDLAHERPEVFGPDLAKSLSLLGYCLEAVGRLPEAVAADEEALRTMLPQFQERPAVLLPMMRALARHYIRRSEKLGREPDAKLLAPIVANLSERGVPLAGKEG